MKKLFSILIVFFVLAGFVLADIGTKPVDSETIAKTSRMALAPLAVSTGLQPIVTENGKVYMSIDALGITSSSGLIQVNKTAGATVRKAYLAAASRGFSNYHITNSDVSINGNNVVFSQELANSISSYNYWADVTNIVKPIIDGSSPGIIDLTINEANSNGVEGTILIVIFDDASQVNDNTIVLAFGAQNTNGDNFAIGLSKPVNKSLSGFALDMSLGISFGYQPAGQYSQIDINGQRLTTSAGGQDDGLPSNGALITAGGIGDSNDNPANPLLTDSSGPRYDDELYSLLPYVNDGDVLISATTLNPSDDDNIFFAGFYLGSTTAVIGEGIVLDPQSATNNLNQQHVVTATVQDTLGNPIASKNVHFEIISGPNVGLTSDVLTDANGKATFSYTSTLEGLDVIEASFYNEQQQLITSNQVTKQWVKSSNALPTIVNGHIYAQDARTPVEGALVEIECNEQELEDTTNAEGYYVVEFFEDCDEGSEIEVRSGNVYAKGIVAKSKVVEKNLVYINLSVPEFSTVAALVALVGSVAVFMVIRKRH